MFESNWRRNLTAAMLLSLTAVLPAVAQEGGMEMAEPEHWAGVELAEAVSQTTGIAISPLLGVSAMGAWAWFRTPDAQRDGLPWFAQEWFWLPALILVVLLVAKDPLLGWLPIIKKPLDALDVVEDKFSALLASAVVIPMLISVFSRTMPSETVSVTGGSSFLLALTAPAVLSGTMGKVVVVLAVIGMMAAFFVTWLASHTINVLILLSPFGPLDMALRAVKGLVLGTLLIAAMIAPVLGLFVSLAIILFAWWVAGWSFRFTVFGSVFGWDILTLKHRGFEAADEPMKAFSGRSLDQLPPRTYGELRADGAGGQVFAYRSWLLLPERRITVPPGDKIVGKGLLAPVLAEARGEDDQGKVVARFPPRFRGHEDQVADRLGAKEVRLLGVRRQFSTLQRWVREMMSGDGEAVAG
jgi:hypothetical protein